MVARRQRRPADDLQQQLLPDPARRRLDAVGRRRARRLGARGRGRGRLARRRGFVNRTLASQLAEIDVELDEVTILALSHAHFDHVGNARLFRRARWYVQEVVYDAMFGPEARRYRFTPALYETLRDNPVVKLQGDHDVFGDGSVRILSTPGHTPGHQSLLVRLAQTGPVVLSGDMAHFRDNYVNRRVPTFSAVAEQARRSMDKIDAVVRAEGAQLWINHDAAQSATIPHAPQPIE